MKQVYQDELVLSRSQLKEQDCKEETKQTVQTPTTACTNSGIFASMKQEIEKAEIHQKEKKNQNFVADRKNESIICPLQKSELREELRLDRGALTDQGSEQDAQEVIDYLNLEDNYEDLDDAYYQGSGQEVGLL